jgi:uncharacterized membrane protein
VPVNTNRLEAFSDGVLAVAITLLVLDITVPTLKTHQTLGGALAARWPNYAAYVTSFITIGIIWVNHHVMIGRLREADYAILMLNLLLLLTVAAIPFATSLLAAYLREGRGDNTAAAVYGGVLLAMAIAFSLLNHHILFRKQHLLARELSLERRRQILSRTLTGLLPYILATGLAAVSAYITLAITAALAAFYALPIASGFDRTD